MLAEPGASQHAACSSTIDILDKSTVATLAEHSQGQPNTGCAPGSTMLA